ncbi:MAG: NAD(P)H-dependent oxidoreductase [Opitutaceae bacterium]|jgi:NAD(P)H-dependent FMN reductase|nr:NAD(P)H-dependent oxidoreductase [Opitutaceae bacterium]|tara:strand:- start:257 stop:778 length:522 start_codon:yes stop_codon:yes gene_type:complete
MKILIVSSSLNPDSKSRLLAQELEKQWKGADFEVTMLDLREANLPMCDGSAAYGDENAIRAKAMVEEADGIVFASPIYVYNVNAALKNFVELTGHSMKDKVAGFLCSAGGKLSYMSPMSFANSLMLDFRMFVLPRFVYVSAEDWNEDQLSEDIADRIGEFATNFADFAGRMTD